MAQFRQERGAAALALEAMRAALLAARLCQPDPEQAGAMQLDLAAMLLRLGMVESGRRALNAAAQSGSDATLTRLAVIAFEANEIEIALAALRRQAQLRPQDATAQWNLAHALSETWQLTEALAALDRAEALAPQPGAAVMRAGIAARQGDAETTLRTLLQCFDAGDTATGSGAAMASLYCDSVTPEAALALHRRLSAHLAADAGPAIIRARGHAPRVGMISPDLRSQHPVGLFMRPVLQRWDDAAMPLHIYVSGKPQPAAMRQLAPRWTDCGEWNDARLASRIAADGIDILVDLSGHTQGQRLGVFGRRAAPVQVTFLGYPYSTGLPTMDWIIADPVVVPAGHESLYSEQVMRLPHSVFCFAPGDSFPAPDFPDSRAASPLVLGCFNNIPKLTDRTLRLWSRIMARLPEARLLLKAPSFLDPQAVAMMRARLAQAGIAPERVETRGPSDLAEMMAGYTAVDIALDPVPYNGGTTTLQAMWMGAPVVARCGTLFVSRMGASFMGAAGLSDWVAASDDEYVEIAVAKARDRAALLALKRGLRERQQAAPAWDIDGYTRDLQAAFLRIWRDG